MSAEMTKAGLAAQLHAETAGGGNGAGEMSGAEAPGDGGFGLPDVETQAPESAAGAAAGPGSFGRKAKAAPTAQAAGQAALNRALPPPQRVRISKRLEGGKYGFIGEYSPQEIGPEPGAWQTFIKRHLKQYIGVGENWFQIESLDANGKLRNHGEHPIMGDPVLTPTTTGTTIYPPQADTVRDQIAAMREMEELSEKRRQAWKSEQDAIRQENERAAKVLEAASTGKGDPMMAFMMTQMMRQHTAPPRDPRDESDFVERQIERRMAPVAAAMNSINERLERLAQVAMNPAPVMQPPPDPMLAVAKIIEAVKPAPVAPPPPPTDQIGWREIMALQDKADTRMERLMQAMKPSDSFGLKDWIAMQAQQEDRTQRLIERMETTTERRLADLKELARDKPAAKGTLEALREAKEIAGLLGGETDSGGTLSQILSVASSPDFWAGFGDFVAQVKGGGATEEEPEDESIQVEERAAPQQQPPQAQRPAPPASRPRAAAPSGVKPSDMGLTDYPETLGPAVAQLVEVSAAEATDTHGTQAQIVAVMGCLQAVMNGSPEWKRRVYTGLRRVALGGPKQVTIWIGPFLRGLAKSGKITLSSSEILLKVVDVNAEAIVAWIKRKTTPTPPPPTPATQ